jgi:glycosyltransferase involved in cell wall biosynthesis
MSTPVASVSSARQATPAGAASIGRRLRLAVVVTHPIQYYVPWYRVAAAREDVELKVFFTWHSGTAAVHDRGFEREVAWDIPLTDGYAWQLVPNTARDPGGHHFFGIRNPALVDAIRAWQADAIHVTGYAYASHLQLMRWGSRAGIPVLFRGDSHLLTPRPFWQRWMRQFVLPRVFSYADACLYVGQHNREYFRAFGVPDAKLFWCPHSIEVDRFAAGAEQAEGEALAMRRDLGIADDRVVMLFAGKFQDEKQPLLLVDEFRAAQLNNVTLLMVGDGPLARQVAEHARPAGDTIRLLPFQNQTRMPVVYRCGDVMVLPSIRETWGMAVNEAMACARSVLVSDRVGCAPEMVVPGATGEVFSATHPAALRDALRRLAGLGRAALLALGRQAQQHAARFNPRATADGVMAAVAAVTKTRRNPAACQK